LGDPAVLMFDEPVNGIDPEGILWIRTLLRALAAEGRTVFVSSHLMSEMALTADHLVVIGRGRLIADCSTAELVASSSQSYVHVKTPDVDKLVAALTAVGADVTEVDQSLRVTGIDSAVVGEVAAREGAVLHELILRQPSLEAAFMELTRDTVEFGGAESVEIGA
jgi:ABC-2 type transport system ATP-binding protein